MKRLPPYRRSGRYCARLGSLLTIGVGAFLIGAALLPADARAGGPEQFVLEFNQRLSSQLGPMDLDEAERQRRFAALLDTEVDLGAASALVLGSRWTSASMQDRAQFRVAFRDYLIRNFAARIHGTGEHPLQITGLVPDGSSVTVSSEIAGIHAAALSVEWRLVRNGDDLWRLSNVTVAGLSMAAVMRAQFDAASDQDDTGLTPLVRLLRDQKRS